MSACGPIQPGMLVIYIGKSDPAALPHELLTIGSTYLVEEIDEGIGNDSCLYPGLVMAGFDGWCFAPTSFRSADPQPKPIEALKQPAPQRELEDA